MGVMDYKVIDVVYYCLLEFVYIFCFCDDECGVFFLCYVDYSMVWFISVFYLKFSFDL